MRKDAGTHSWILPVIVVSQFGCTSLWFAGNAVIADLAITFNAGEKAVAHLTAAVQSGFILGTLIFALLSIADRYSPSKVFLVCAVLGALFNILIIYLPADFTILLSLRILTGFFLAGIYPVGMKIAADHFEKGLGQSLGYLVGALVLGTSFPHLLRGLTSELPWKLVLIITSVIALAGGMLMFLLVPDGIFRKPKQKTDIKTIPKVFKNSYLRSSALGYFGHMWELYAFWAFIPTMIMSMRAGGELSSASISIIAFAVIAVGAVSCMIGGKIAYHAGTKKTATVFLLLSCCCCLLSPLVFALHSLPLLIIFLLLWGMFVTGDSPLFSTLVAQHAPPEIKGTALTITNCIGFSITIISIQVISSLQALIPIQYLFTILAIGPICGLIALQAGNDKKVNRLRL